MKKDKLTRLIILFATILCFAAYLVVTIPKAQFSSFDDAYMFLRYAKNWLAGNGFSWNAVDGPVYGITSFAHLILVTFFRAITSLSDVSLLPLISFTAGILALAVLVAIGFIFFERLRRFWSPLLILPIIVFGSAFKYHSTTGMETTLSLFFNSLFVAATIYVASRRSKLGLALVLIASYLVYLTRPDMGIFCLVFPPLFIIASEKSRWKTALAYLLTISVILIGDILLKKAIFGDFIPLPAIAKSISYYRGYIGAKNWNSAVETMFFLRETLPFLIIIILFCNKKSLPKVGAIFIPIVLTFGYYLQVIQIMGYYARYYLPSLPFVILAAYISLDSYLKYNEESLSGYRTYLRASIAILLFAVITSPWIETAMERTWAKLFVAHIDHYRAETEYRTSEEGDLPELGWWDSKLEMDSLLQKLPSGISVASSEYGYLSAMNMDISFIDIVGLHDRQVAAEGFSADVLFEKNPDLIWFPHPHYTYITKNILDNDIFQERYSYYPGVYDFGIAFFKNSPYYGTIDSVFAREFGRVYSPRSAEDYLGKPIQPHISTEESLTD